MTENRTKSPYGNLMTDLLFKKAFNPDDDYTKVNLINLLNDILAPQLKRPIRDLRSRDKEVNRTGSGASRTSAFDLHCKDDDGRLFIVEVQIKPFAHFLKRVVFYACQDIAKQGTPGDKWAYDFSPVFIVTISWAALVDDDRFIHHLSFCDIETKARAGDYLNISLVELSKFPGLGEKPNALRKWLYLFRNLDKITELPPEIQEDKFTRLLPIAEVAKLGVNELEEYEMERVNQKWDEYAAEIAFEELAKEAAEKGMEKGMEKGLEKGIQKGALDKAKEMAKAMLKKGMSVNEVADISKLSEDVIREL